MGSMSISGGQALSNPHATIRLMDPEGKTYNFVRSVEELPVKTKGLKAASAGDRDQ